MRIGMIFSTPFPPVEGIGFYVWNLARQLAKQGHTVHLITRGKIAPLQSEIAQGIVIWKPPFLPVYPFHVDLHTLFVNHLIKKLESQLDLLHLHSPLVKAPRTSLPILVTVHTPIRADSRAVRVRNLSTLLIKLQTPFSLAVETDLLHRANQVIAVANSVAQELGEYGINPQGVAVLWNGVDTHLFQPALTGAENQPPTVLTVGRLAPRKGLEDLLECAYILHKEQPNLRFILLGDGPLKGELQTMATKLGLKDVVIFYGHIHDRAELVRHYQNASVYVQPSHYEGMPTTLLEAMACAKPIVATAVSGHLDILKDGENSLLVAPRQPEQLARAVRYLLSAPQQARRLGAAARQAVCEQYTWEAIAQNYIRQYQSLLERHHQ